VYSHLTSLHSLAVTRTLNVIIVGVSVTSHYKKTGFRVYCGKLKSLFWFLRQILDFYLPQKHVFYDFTLSLFFAEALYYDTCTLRIFEL